MGKKKPLEFRRFQKKYMRKVHPRYRAECKDSQGGNGFHMVLTGQGKPAVSESTTTTTHTPGHWPE